jgi:Ca2+-binding RTX toxin-like protein
VKLSISRRTGIRALTTGALLAISAATITATPAQALTTNVTAISGKLSVNAGIVGDHITINVENGSLVVRNFNDAITAGSFTCANVDARTVRCNSAGITDILVNSQDGDDTVTNNTGLTSRVFLGPGGDTFSGGSARDFVNGGGDNDLIDGNGGSDILIGDAGGFDQVFGGAGTDFCNAEAETSCEGDA